MKIKKILSSTKLRQKEFFPVQRSFAECRKYLQQKIDLFVFRVWYKTTSQDVNPSDGANYAFFVFQITKWSFMMAMIYCYFFCCYYESIYSFSWRSSRSSWGSPSSYWMKRRKKSYKKLVYYIFYEKVSLPVSRGPRWALSLIDDPQWLFQGHRTSHWLWYGIDP